MTETEWWDLWRRDPRATPFQCPAWLGPWWTHLGGRGERLDLVARDGGGRSIGFLPAWIWDDGGLRRLVPLGAGVSDYLDALIDPGREAEALAGLWRAALDASDRWDELLLPDLRPDSPLLQPPPEALHARDEAHETCPVLALPADGPVLAALSKSRRRKIVHDHHRAERLGEVETGFPPPEELPAVLDALFALHAARWEAAGEPGVLADPAVQAFHREAAPALQAAGLLRLTTVRWRGDVRAVLLGFCDGRRGYSYINGVDREPAGQSFGTLAFAHQIDAAQEGGAREFHFLRGEEPYKYAWGAEPLRTVRRVVRRRG